MKVFKPNLNNFFAYFFFRLSTQITSNSNHIVKNLVRWVRELFVKILNNRFRFILSNRIFENLPSGLKNIDPNFQ